MSSAMFVDRPRHLDGSQIYLPPHQDRNPHRFHHPLRQGIAKDAYAWNWAAKEHGNIQDARRPPAQRNHSLGHLVAVTAPASRLVVPTQAQSASSEYMLRRKTPNGTLSAGYDGTPVEWASGSHADKHIVLADSDLERLTRQNQQPFGHAAQARSQQHVHPPSAPAPGGTWPSLGGSVRMQNSPVIVPDYGHEQKRWNQPIDSMLFQSPTSMDHIIPRAGQQRVQEMVQPAWPSNFGPTASNAPAPYGPYWPNGAFEPYRPASHKDHRFHDQFASINLNDPGEGPPATPRDAFHHRNSWQGGLPNYPPQNQHQQQHLDHAHPPRSDLSFARRASDITQGRILPAGHVGNQWPSTKISQLSGDASFREMSVGHGMHFKERILQAAHQTYRHLVASVQNAKRYHHHQQQQQKHHQAPLSIPNQPSGGEMTPNRLHKSAHGLRPAHLERQKSDFDAGYPERPSPFSARTFPLQHVPPQSPSSEARSALDMLARLSEESGWKWIDGLLLGGCLAYGLGEFQVALELNSRIIACDPSNVEAMSNIAATFSALGQKADAEEWWTSSVKLRPSHFEAVEHLVGLLCTQHRGREAVKIIEFVEQSLRMPSDPHTQDLVRQAAASNAVRVNGVESVPSDLFRIPASDHGRMIALTHAKGNMLYALGDNAAAARAFEDAVLVGAGRRSDGIGSLIKEILRAFAEEIMQSTGRKGLSPCEAVLLAPEVALKTAQMVFPSSGEMPGIRCVAEGQPKKAAISVISNSLLSLAKIFQDSMSSAGAGNSALRANVGVQDILALYYLSLSLQPSPSTANNVGILLASIQQSVPQKASTPEPPAPLGIPPGNGIALAFSYYNYGLNLDSRHAHLYTNLGSLLKDIGQLGAAVDMYKKAVACDSSFDIALANLANAVKDQGHVGEAIEYYKRAVVSNPDFAEAVCGLANALNSVCNWKDRGGVVFEDAKYDRWHVNDHGMLYDAKEPLATNSGWIGRVVDIVLKQLRDGLSWGAGVLQELGTETLRVWALAGESPESRDKIVAAIGRWGDEHWEGGRVVRFIERATKRISWQAYQDKYVAKISPAKTSYLRPTLPPSLTIPNAPTVLPFHTFTCPLGTNQIRMISQRNGLRISVSTLRSQWLPKTVFDPPPPPDPCLRVGYVSSDFNNHPLAHLMQSVFGLHDRKRVRAFCYATTPSDGSSHRVQIEREAPVFYDAHAWPVDRLVNRIVSDGIHILINLNGYTRGARNEVFAARPAPIQMSFMGFAGTMGAEWCDYLLADKTSIPKSMLRPYRRNVDLADIVQDGNYAEDREWIYGENIIYTRDTFFCCDHKQSAPDANLPQTSWTDEKAERLRLRHEVFKDIQPAIPDDAVILGNFNQLYKIEPTTFRTWLRILAAVPTARLWLLRFPDLGEKHLAETAELWSSPAVANRIVFTDVAQKSKHIERAKVCDLFLDTPECNAHTTAADVLWSGTPLLTFPRWESKMCSRMAGSILRGALPKDGDGERAAADLIVASDQQYEDRAIELARGMADQLAREKAARRPSLLPGEETAGSSGGGPSFAKRRRESVPARDGRNNGGGPSARSAVENHVAEERARREIADCRLLQLRRLLYENRRSSGLFDTRRWVRDLEDAYEIAWDRWVRGEGGDIFLDGSEDGRR